MPYIDQPIVVGNTHDFKLTAKKDGSVWDISGATITLYLRKPDGTVLSGFSASITNGPAGLAHYQVDNDDLDVAGDWARQWKVVKSGVELKTKIIPFTVDPSLV
jgi:hypothetical protein